MSFARNYHSQGGTLHDDRWSFYNQNNYNDRNMNTDTHIKNNYNYNWNYNHFNDLTGNVADHFYNSNSYVNPSNGAPSMKRRKFSAASWGDVGRHVIYGSVSGPLTYSNTVSCTGSNAEISMSTCCKRDHSTLEDDEPIFMSRDEIERHSPSRKNGIDAQREAYLWYSYCAFLQKLGLQLELPQTTIGTAMVLCHRFFVRRSHACHDRFSIATAALFLASKSEETPRPLNNVLGASFGILHKQEITFLACLPPVDWFENYRERVIEAEQMILTTLNFELNVHHPYAPLTSVLDKLGFSKSMMVYLALSLVSEGLRSSLWLQFKPHEIAAGAAYLAARFLNLDLACYQNIWHEFQTTPAIVQDVAQQLMELFA